MFCVKCGTILTVNDEKQKLNCPSCGYAPRGSQKLVLKEKTDLKDFGGVLDEKKLKTLPSTKAECNKCGGLKAYYWFVQTRAGDEAETKFFECVKCHHRWRSYD